MCLNSLIIIYILQQRPRNGSLLSRGWFIIKKCKNNKYLYGVFVAPVDLGIYTYYIIEIPEYTHNCMFHLSSPPQKYQIQ